MMLLLLQYLGIKGISKGALLLLKWAVRFVVFAVLLALLVVLGRLVWTNSQAFQIACWIVGGLFGWMIVRAWRQRNREISETQEPGERTIDGKIVPHKLAVAALDVPLFSPDGEDVLRGLPDYGKVLLKLDSAAFEYLPPPPEPEPAAAPLPQEEPAISKPRITFKQRMLATAIVVPVMLVIAVVAGYLQRPASPVGANSPSVTQPVTAAAQAPTTSTETPAPPQSILTPETPAPDKASPLRVRDSETPAVSPAPAVSPDLTEKARQELKAYDKAMKVWRDSTGLLWQLHDNDSDISEKAAAFFCALHHDGGRDRWRLPTRREITRLIAEGSGGQITISSGTPILWTSESADTNMHYVIYLKGNDKGQLIGSEDDTKTDNMRVLCVHD